MKISCKALVASAVVVSLGALASESLAKGKRKSSSRGGFSSRTASSGRGSSFQRSMSSNSSSFKRSHFGRSASVPKFTPKSNVRSFPKAGVGSANTKIGRDTAVRTPNNLSKVKSQILRKPLKPNLVTKDKIKILPHPGHAKGHGHKHGHKHGHQWWLANPLLVRHTWCHRRPVHCHWWYDYCRPIRHCAPAHCVYYTYDYVHCGGGYWYLGLKGTLLPGKGVGIESIEAGSPAAIAGLKPGMVITRTNEMALVANESMSTAIANSNGVLNLAVLASADGKASNVRVAMKRMAATGF